MRVEPGEQKVHDDLAALLVDVREHILAKRDLKFLLVGGCVETEQLHVGQPDPPELQRLSSFYKRDAHVVDDQSPALFQQSESFLEFPFRSETGNQ